MRQPSSRYGPALLVALVFVGLLGRVWVDPTRWQPGAAYVDGYGTQWYFWFVGEVLSGRQPFDHTTLLFHPWGKDLYLHTGGNLLDAALAWPLRVVFGGVLGYNFWVLFVCASNCWAGTQLAAAVEAPAGWRWPAGLALLLDPALLTELDQGRPTQAWVLFPALCAAYLWEMRNARQAALAGLFMGLSALQYWYYGVALAGLAVIQAIVTLARDRSIKAIGRQILAAAVAAAVVLPAAWPMLGRLSAGEVPGLLAMDGDGLFAPLALRTEEGDREGLYVLAAFQGSFGSIYDEGEGETFRAGTAAFSWAGLVAVGLFIGRWGRWGVMSSLRRAGEPGPRTPDKTPLSNLVPWSITALLIASGPAFVIGEHLYPNRIYLFALEHLDLLRRWWWPGRASIGLGFVVAALTGLSLYRLPRAPLVGGGLLCLAIWQLHRMDLYPLPRWDGDGSPALTCLASAPPGAVIDLPLLGSQENLYLQTIHHQPLLGGMLLKKAAFGASGIATLREENALLADLIAIGERQYTRKPTVSEGDAAILVEKGYRYVLLNRGAFTHTRSRADGEVQVVSDAPRAERLLERLIGTPAFADDRFVVYTLDGSALGCG